MSDIFISYASEDRFRVEPLSKELEAQGWSVWWDRAIPAGKSFTNVIETALADARCVIVVWSSQSVTSNWVRDEAEEGQKRGILIPVLIDNVRPPMGFRSIQAAQLFDWDGITETPAIQKLIADIMIIIGSPPIMAAKQELQQKKAHERLVSIDDSHESRETERQKTANLLIQLGHSLVESVSSLILSFIRKGELKWLRVILLWVGCSAAFILSMGAVFDAIGIQWGVYRGHEIGLPLGFVVAIGSGLCLAFIYLIKWWKAKRSGLTKQNME